MARNTHGESFDTDLDDYEYLQDAYSYNALVEEYESSFEQKAWEDEPLTAYENGDSGDDIESELAAAQTRESELTIEAPPISQAVFHSQDKPFINDNLTERSASNMSEVKRTLSDAAIVRELESIKSYIDEKINGLEEVNKLWFHTISHQLQVLNKKSVLEPSDDALQEIAELFAVVIENQEKILTQSKSDHSALKKDTSKMLENRYVNTFSDDAVKSSLRDKIDRIEKKISKTNAALIIAIIILVFMLIRK